MSTGVVLYLVLFPNWLYTSKSRFELFESSLKTLTLQGETMRSVIERTAQFSINNYLALSQDQGSTDRQGPVTGLKGYSTSDKSSLFRIVRIIGRFTIHFSSPELVRCYYLFIDNKIFKRSNDILNTLSTSSTF